MEEKSGTDLPFNPIWNHICNDLAETFYNKIYYQQFSLVKSEIISYLDYLEAEKITKEFTQGIWRYR